MTDEPSTSSSPSSADESRDEVALKQERVTAFLDSFGLDAVVLWGRGNFAWATCGGDNHIPNASETGIAAILFTRDTRICLTTNIESPRMRTEELVGRGIDTVEYPWHDDAATRRVVTETITDLGLAVEKVAADVDKFGLGLAALPAAWGRLRWQLTPAEIERYREGAMRAAGAMESACEAVERGMTEHDVAAVLDGAIRSAGLTPTVTLIAADERIERYRHPIPTEHELRQTVMLVSCSSYGGLISNLTRFVHFGKVPADLAQRQQAVADVDAAANLVTRPGRSLGQVFADIQEAYAEVGHPEQWRLHHQGGSTGYAGRECFATPGDQTVVLDAQAFAWNPSLVGVKSEDTVLVTDDSLEVLTAHSESWPTIEGRCEDGDLPRAGWLVKD